MKTISKNKVCCQLLALVAVVLLPFTGAAAAGAAPGPAATMTSSREICLDVADQNGSWLTEEVCDEQAVTPTGGIYGLGVRLINFPRDDQIDYSVYYDGAWHNGKNGQKVGEVGKPITALNVTLSPRRGKSLCYTIIDMNFLQTTKCNGTIVGSTAANAPQIRSIRITLR